MHLLRLMSITCSTRWPRSALGHAGQGEALSATTDPSAPVGVSPGTTHGDVLAARLCRAAPRTCTPLRLVQDQAPMASPSSLHLPGGGGVSPRLVRHMGWRGGGCAQPRKRAGSPSLSPNPLEMAGSVFSCSWHCVRAVGQQALSRAQGAREDPAEP